MRYVLKTNSGLYLAGRSKLSFYVQQDIYFAKQWLNEKQAEKMAERESKTFWPDGINKFTVQEVQLLEISKPIYGS